MKMEQTGCSETLAYKLQTPVNHPEAAHNMFHINEFVELKYNIGVGWHGSLGRLPQSSVSYHQIPVLLLEK
jgi:hypothetical protein